MQWFVQPEAVQVDIAGGQWLLLKKRLTVGEERKSMASLVTEIRADGRMTPNFENVGKSDVLAYLVDWSLTQGGKRVDIDTDAKKASAIDNLSPEAFAVISEAVSAHVKAMDAERDAEKNARAGENASSATSASAA
jgi:hypothetical protein